MFKPHSHRWIAAALLATTSMLTFAPLALADRGHGNGNGRRYKGQGAVVQRAYSPQRVYVRHQSSSAGPVLAGLIGGFILGTAVSHASDRNYHPAPARTYRYYDPSCDETYASLDECRMHFREHRRSPRVIRVIEVSSGECVRTVRYDDGDWREDDRDWREDDRDWREDDDRDWDQGGGYRR